MSLRIATFVVGLLFTSSLSFAFDIALDIDETILKEVPVEYKASRRVQSIHYKPREESYLKYKKRIENPSSDAKRVIHYDLHEEDQTMTGYVVVRPGIEKLLTSLMTMSQKKPKLWLISANDWNRTQAVVEQLRIGGKTLKEWGAIPLSPDGFVENWNKNVESIRRMTQTDRDTTVCFIDDLPEIYFNATANDMILGITSWDYEHGVMEYLNHEKDLPAENAIVKKIVGELETIIHKLNSVESEVDDL